MRVEKKTRPAIRSLLRTDAPALTMLLLLPRIQIQIRSIQVGRYCSAITYYILFKIFFYARYPVRFRIAQTKRVATTIKRACCSAYTRVTYDIKIRNDNYYESHRPVRILCVQIHSNVLMTPTMATINHNTIRAY